MRKRPSFVAVDFFCGAGGTTRGLIGAGGYVIAGVDKDGSCERTYVENNPNRTLDGRSPLFLNRDVFPKSSRYPQGEQQMLVGTLDGEIRRARAMAPGVPLLFAICAPCQPFTKLSHAMSERRETIRRRDSNLLSVAADLVERYKPDMILSENVSGIADPKYGGIWQAFRRRLERLGYETGSKVVCTSDFGIPQYRRRSILVAVKRRRLAVELRGRADGLPVPERDARAPVRTVQEALDRFPAIAAGEIHPDVPNHMARAVTEINLKRLKAVKPGQSNATLRRTRYGDLRLPCHKRVSRRMGENCFTDAYTRMRPDRPSPTITTKCHSFTNGRFGHYDRSQNRAISLREAATLQSFPVGYVFHPRNEVGVVARMIGNAVPPKLARFFARHLVGMLA